MRNQRNPRLGIRAAVLLLGSISLAGLGCNGQPAAETAATPASSSSTPGAVSTNMPVAEQPPAPAPSPAGAAKSKADPGPASTDTTPGARHEPLFVGWPKPSLALFISGQQYGYIEPCGCSGLTNQKGGLVRRYACKQQLEQQGWDVVALDVGNQVRRFGRQAEIKFQVTAEGLKKMKYRAIGFGPDDLRLSPGELIAITADEGNSGTPFVCANAAIIDRTLTPRFQVIEAAGKKIGVTAVLGADELAKVTSDEIIKQPPEESLREVWAELDKQDCDLYVLLAHASIEESAQLRKRFPISRSWSPPAAPGNRLTKRRRSLARMRSWSRSASKACTSA